MLPTVVPLIAPPVMETLAHANDEADVAARDVVDVDVSVVKVAAAGAVPPITDELMERPATPDTVAPLLTVVLPRVIGKPTAADTADRTNAVVATDVELSEPESVTVRGGIGK